VNFTANQISGGGGGNGGSGASGTGGAGGDGTGGGGGGAGGNGAEGTGGNGGNGGLATGGGIGKDYGGIITIKPRLGAKKRSKQSRAMNLITANLANGSAPGSGGMKGDATAGRRGGPGGTAGSILPGSPGVNGAAGAGIGGGLDLGPAGMSVIDNTTITGNHASTSNDDVAGSFST
jgi:hypothetical protein